MHVRAARQIDFDGSFSGWNNAARAALANGWSPEEVVWANAKNGAGLNLFAEAEINPATPATEFRVPKAFLESAKTASHIRSGEQWPLLYRMLWRLTHGEPKLLEIATDADVRTLQELEKSIRRDIHKMRAFVRFREVATESGPWFVAWFEPQHLIVETNAKFFVDRFASMRWSILTPDRCAHWDMEKLWFTPGVAKSEAPAEDAKEALWLTYYSSIFNPARVKVKAMQKEMPKKYWRNLPEATLIAPLLHEAPRRTATMIETSRSRQVVESDYSVAQPPRTDDWNILREAARTCKACPLWKDATCTVFGEGRLSPRVVFVGEQPGDSEDRVGKPFIGPAGQLFDRALAKAGFDRMEAYVTNAVKHFKWEPKGKRRIHKTPSSREVAACRPWLEAELGMLKPKLIVALGATAAKSLLQEPIRVTENRGRILESAFGKVLVTLHPSALLRLPSGADEVAEFEKFVMDLRLILAFA